MMKRNDSINEAVRIGVAKSVRKYVWSPIRNYTSTDMSLWAHVWEFVRIPTRRSSWLPLGKLVEEKLEDVIFEID
jgi:hypothetical protein